jgi:uncharacterized protein (DUF302 family)
MADYGFGKRVDANVDEAIEAITVALAAEGFGILTRIDVHAVLKKKLGVDRPPYVILGACNPHLASAAIDAEEPIGLLLPCNVLVAAHPDGGSTIRVADPTSMGEMTGNRALKPLMDDAAGRLRRALDAV